MTVRRVREGEGQEVADRLLRESTRAGHPPAQFTAALIEEAIEAGDHIFIDDDGPPYEEEPTRLVVWCRRRRGQPGHVNVVYVYHASARLPRVLLFLARFLQNRGFTTGHWSRQSDFSERALQRLGAARGPDDGPEEVSVDIANAITVLEQWAAQQ